MNVSTIVSVAWEQARAYGEARSLDEAGQNNVVPCLNPFNESLVHAKLVRGFEASLNVYDFTRLPIDQ